MSAEQFHQVVLLPQGQFAKFLHSDAGERTALLQRLFGTDRFRKIEDWLGEQRRHSKDALEQARHGVRRLIARAAQACGEARARPRRRARSRMAGSSVSRRPRRSAAVRRRGCRGRARAAGASAGGACGCARSRQAAAAQDCGARPPARPDGWRRCRCAAPRPSSRRPGGQRRSMRRCASTRVAPPASSKRAGCATAGASARSRKSGLRRPPRSCARPQPTGGRPSAGSTEASELEACVSGDGAGAQRRISRCAGCRCAPRRADSAGGAGAGAPSCPPGSPHAASGRLRSSSRSPSRPRETPSRRWRPPRCAMPAPLTWRSWHGAPAGPGALPSRAGRRSPHCATTGSTG